MEKKRENEMRDLKEIRKDIDAIDAEIITLYEKRMALADDVASYKIANHMPVYDKEREQEKLTTLSKMTEDPFTRQGIRELFTSVMSGSRKKQYRILSEHGILKDFGYNCVKSFDFSDCKIAFQGVEGAYSEAALVKFFGKDHNTHSVQTWREAFEELKNHKADYAVLPIENSTAGMIDENFDLMTEYDCAIIGEQIIRINHALLGLPEANIQDIKTVYSHPQALMQCSDYLNENHPEFDRRSLLNTAMSAKKVKEDGLVSQAAIAGKINAEIYGLKILDEKIQDDKTNATRFLIVSSQKNFLEDANKLSISFELNDDMGSLYHILSNFTYNGLNMSRIESRPVKERPWAYRFFVDLSGNLNNEAVQNALVGLHEEANSIQILGNY